MSIDDRLLEGLRREFGAQFRDRRDDLTRFGVRPPLRAGGAVAVAAFVVHHTAGSQRGTYDAIWQYHCRTLGWDAPGYGIFIGMAGVVELAVPPSRINYGVLGRHGVTYNLTLPGNYNNDWATPAQLDALYRTLCCLDDAYGADGRIWRGHKEWNLRGRSTACPGAHLMPHVQVMRSRLYGAAKPRPAHYTASA